MIAARFSHSLARLPVVAALAALVSVGACRDDDTPTTAAAQATLAPARGSGPTPPAEVVIARSTIPYQAEMVITDGSVSGTVVTSAPLRQRPPVPTGRDSLLCGREMADETVTQQGRSLGGVVVWLDDIRRGKSLPLERRLELESNKCRLLPRVQAGVVGSAVNVLGHDALRQHLYFLAGGEREARAMVLLDSDEQVIPTERPFVAPGLVIVRDADRPWPTAYVAVFDHPYFAITAPDGSFSIDDIPPGRYTLRTWHERTKRSEQIVEVPGGGVAQLAITLSEQ